MAKQKDGTFKPERHWVPSSKHTHLLINKQGRYTGKYCSHDRSLCGHHPLCDKSPF